jgi:ribosomal-protein-alanine N-acetyltransferase
MNNEIKYDDFIIRTYRKGDYNGISRLWEMTDMSGDQRGDNEKIIEDTIDMGGCLLVMENKPTGLICGTSWITFDGRRLHLHHFGILPAYQGNGLSKILLKETLHLVKEKGYQVKLEVHTNNYKAIDLYKKAGFEHLNGYLVYIIRSISKL